MVQFQQRKDLLIIQMKKSGWFDYNLNRGLKFAEQLDAVYFVVTYKKIFLKIFKLF